MAMTAGEFVEQLKLVQAGVKMGETSPEIEERLASLAATVKRTWNPEQLKAAISGSEAIPTPLEEAFTTLRMLWLSRRGQT